ncbi:MAG: polysaccharide deacetylase [Acidobacteria bacterium]|nr:polysaccharide deacetylase [Acidobacteriota bacterium]
MHSILVYHTISEPAVALPGDIDISREKFARQLQWLARRRQVVRLAETLSGTSKRLTAITFDDGYRDNLTVALPLLEKFELPMTLFVTAGFVGREGYLSRDELREMSRHPLITIGAHGLWHRHFTLLDAAEARHEMMESRSQLESITGLDVDLMAWPYGECNVELEALSKECGYRAAWSVWKGSNAQHSLWRVPLGRRDNMLRFIAKASGAYFPTKVLEQKWERFRNGGDNLECADPSALSPGATRRSRSSVDSI